MEIFFFLLLVLVSQSCSSPTYTVSRNDNEYTSFSSSQERNTEESLKVLSSYVTFVKSVIGESKPIFEEINSIIKLLNPESLTLPFDDALNAIEDINTSDSQSLSRVISAVSAINTQIKALKGLEMINTAIQTANGRYAAYYNAFVKLFDVIFAFVSKTVTKIRLEQPLIYNALRALIHEKVVCSLPPGDLVPTGYCPKPSRIEGLIDLWISLPSFEVVLSGEYSTYHIIELVQSFDSALKAIPDTENNTDAILLGYVHSIVYGLRAFCSKAMILYNVQFVPDIQVSSSDIRSSQVSEFLQSSLKATVGLNKHLKKLKANSTDSQDSLNKLIENLEKLQSNPHDEDAFEVLESFKLNTKLTNTQKVVNVDINLFNKDNLLTTIELFSEASLVLVDVLSYTKTYFPILYLNSSSAAYQNLECWISGNSSCYSTWTLASSISAIRASYDENEPDAIVLKSGLTRDFVYTRDWKYHNTVMAIREILKFSEHALELSTESLSSFSMKNSAETIQFSKALFVFALVPLVLFI